MPLPFLPLFYTSPCIPLANKEDKKSNKESNKGGKKLDKTVDMVLLLRGSVVAKD